MSGTFIDDVKYPNHGDMWYPKDDEIQYIWIYDDDENDWIRSNILMDSKNAISSEMVLRNAREIKRSVKLEIEETNRLISKYQSKVDEDVELLLSAGYSGTDWRVASLLELRRILERGRFSL